MSVTKTCDRCGGSGKISIDCNPTERCPSCNRPPEGYELDGQTPCSTCGGSTRVTCRDCGGSGSRQIDCPKCHGTGTVEEPY